MQGCLGGAVVSMRGPRPNASQRSDVDHAPVVIAQCGAERLGHEEGRAHIDGERLIPLVDGDLIKVSRVISTGIVDEQVKFPQLGYRLSRRIRNRLGVTEVAAQAHDIDTQSLDFRGGFESLPGGVEIGNRNICPGTGERKRDLAADPLRAAGDQGSFTREREMVGTAQRFSSTGFGS